MVEEYETLRDDLDAEVFAPYGKSVTLINKSLPIYDDRGELTSSTETSSTITIVPYNIFESRTHEAFGDSNEEVMEAAVRYDVAISENDKIVMEGVTYLVRGKQTNYLPENVAYIINLVKQEP